jgi:hypothetical protein
MMTPDRPAGDEGTDGDTGEEDGTGELPGPWEVGLDPGDDLGPDQDGPAARPMPGLSGALSSGVVGGLGQSRVILEPKSSTPFDVAEAAHAVPSSALWAMKYLRHGRYGLSSGGDDGPDRIRWASDEVAAAGATDAEGGPAPDDPAGADDQAGADDTASADDKASADDTASGDDAAGADGGGPVYVIDDGSDHCMVARLVGASPDGCTYCLVARIKRPDFDDVRAGWSPATDLFTVGKEFTLCGVVEGSVSNVVRVGGYRRYKHVPAEYLPPSPFIEFDEPI